MQVGFQADAGYVRFVHQPKEIEKSKPIEEEVDSSIKSTPLKAKEAFQERIQPHLVPTTILKTFSETGAADGYASHPVIKDTLEFLENSPTAWQAVSEVSKKLLNAGYRELKEDEVWDIKPGGKYFVTNNGSSIIAFVMPSGEMKSATILGAHTDSPGLKLKPNPDVASEECHMLSTQIYGGPIVPSWYNRMLGIAGRCYYLTDKNEVRELLVDIREPIANIPQIAVHLDRDRKLEVKTNPQTEMRAIVAANLDLSGRSYIQCLIEEKYGVTPLPGYELFLVPIEKPIAWGPKQQFISGARLDNLLGCHASLTALLSSSEPSEKGVVKMMVLWDNEEVGSQTKQGAQGPFLPDTLLRIQKKMGLRSEERAIFLKNSYLVSNDVAHQCHPNFPEKHDARHKPHPARGIVIKTYANQNYATDSGNEARFVKVLKDEGLPFQQFTVRSDSTCGSTIGPIVSGRTGIDTIDVGELVLSMHSVIEQGSCPDHLQMTQGLTGLLNSKG